MAKPSPSKQTQNTAAQPDNPGELILQLPDPADLDLSEHEFQQQLQAAWVVCDRFDLQTDIWRGRILRAIRDREKQTGEGRGGGFLNWLQNNEISKSQAYSWIELANSADTLLEAGHLQPESIRHFSKRAFVKTAQSPPEVQELISETASQGERITSRQVQQLSDEWTAMTSDLLPAEIKTKAANHTLPLRHVAPLVKELEKLPATHQATIQAELAANPDIDSLKQATAEARQLTKYLEAFSHVQALKEQSVDLESSLEEALRLGCLNITADLVNQASQLEHTVAKLYTTWRRLRRLTDKLHLSTGASTPHLQSLLQALERLYGDVLEVELSAAGSTSAETISIQVLSEEHASE
ncbi:MAG: hypothetical protein HC851_06395 [Acaryochloris sp. RU_4_1]|nr:hypothetical protein [Acaryochloris sp. SU_5_25]NJM65315.1 hypothetical protein [Acaryochloris sp. RU_4_1]NJR54673.1 hypothetical protein [Acaryochloris sp. CRU_2_0]